MVHPTTPVRALDLPVVEGCRVLASPDIEWRDGSEDELLRRVLAASDLSSSSDELAQTARTWPEHYHLSTARANLVRPFAFSPEHRVLEVGAGCGAVTRWLGEQCGCVDALEPVQARARVLRARTRDLDSVEVFVGEVGDVPEEAAYDVVVVVGVLEYVGGGTPDAHPYVEFLTHLRRRLRPGGRLFLAIENKLGVKYLAGAPEDHTGRVFDSVEGYPVGSPARTFSRSELLALLEASGFTSNQVFGAFPDYKLTRLVYTDAAAQTAPGLLQRLPVMPSPDWDVPRPRLVDEGLLWGSFVDAGLAGEVPNSFVVVAGSPDSSPLWPRDVLATYYSVGRTAAYVMRSDVRGVDGGLVVDRRREHAHRPQADWLRLRPGREAVAAGVPLPEAVPDGDGDALLATLLHWRGVLTALPTPEAHFDAVPHNVVFNGIAKVVDDEWECGRSTLGHVVGRGLFYLVCGLAGRPGWAKAWEGRRVEDVMRELAAGLDLPVDESWPELEAAVQDTVLQKFEAAAASALEERLRAQAGATIVHDPLGRLRDFERFTPVMEQERDRLAAENESVRTQLESAEEARRRLEQERATILEDRWYRVGTRYRSAMEAVAPPGTRRGKAYTTAVRARRGSSS